MTRVPDELPAEMADPGTRKQRIRRALADIEAEKAADAAKRDQQSQAQRDAARDYERRVAEQGEQGELPGRGVRPKGRDPAVIARANLKRKIVRAQGQMDGYQRRAQDAARGGRPMGRKPLGGGG